MVLGRTHHTEVYMAIMELSKEETGYSVASLCRFAGVSRAGYYKWTSHENSPNDRLNKKIADKLDAMYTEYSDMGYRRLRDALEHDDSISVNDKKIRRLCRKKKIQSIVKGRHNRCTKPASDPAYVDQNILNREFKADEPN